MPVQYNKTLWKGHVVTYPRRYHEETQDGETLHTPAFGTVITEGTPFSPDNMNKIENGIEAVSALANELENSKASTALYTVTIPTTGWTGTAAPYTRAITVNGITSADAPVIDVKLTGNYQNDVLICDAWASIQRIVTGSNKITVTAELIPEIAIPIQVRCIR